MFKEITAQFKVTEDTAFNEGRWKEDRGYFIFEVKRMVSGASAYGDRSCHSCIIANVPSSFQHHFDTRYSGIKPEKKEWIEFWKNWIEDEYSLKVELDAYEEETVEIKEGK